MELSPRSVNANCLTMRSRPSPSTASGDGSDPPDAQGRPGSKKRQQVAVACAFCQVRKCKCDGRKPSCASCLRKGTKCVYEVDGDCRRVDQLRRRNTALTERCLGLEHLLTCLRSCDESEAAELLQRVRTGEDVTDTVNFARNGHFQSQGTGERTAYTQLSKSTVATAQRSRHSSWKASSDGQSLGETPYPSNVSSPDIEPWEHSNLAACKSGMEPGSTRSLSERPFGTLEIDVNCEELESSPSEMFDETVTLAQPPNLRQSLYRGPDKAKGEWVQPSARGNLGKTVISTEMERVPSSTSTSSLLRTEAWIETIDNFHMQKSSSDSTSENQTPASRLPSHLILPNWKLDDAPINRVISDYLSAARQQVAQGSPVADILAPEYINVQAFFRPANTLGFPTVSEWASEVNKRLRNVHTFVCLANVVLQTYLMRWLIQPTLDNYTKMPAMIRPTRMQMLYPHMAAISTIPLPAVRDALIQTPLGQRVSSLGDLISCTWPYPPSQCVEVNHSSAHVRLTAKFEAHVTDPNNWYVDKTIIEALPELEGKVQMKQPVLH